MIVRTLAAGRYELRELIAEGPHGTLWRARHSGTRERVAVKVIAPRFAGNPAVVDRFVQEFDVLARYFHPVYVRLRDLVADGAELAIVTELVDGVDLRSRLAQTGPLPPAKAAAIVRDCAEALAAGHCSGVVHCDVRPSNIMLAKAGTVRLTDCRVARLARGPATGRNRLADVRYAAPELLAGEPPVPATDVFELAVVLHQLLTGFRPRDGADVTGGPAIAAPLRDVLAACLATDPAARPKAGEVAAWLRDTDPARARRAVPPRPAQPVAVPRAGAATPRRTRRRRIALLASAAVISVAGLTAVKILAPPEPARSAGAGAAPTATHRIPTMVAASAAPQLPADATIESAAGAESFAWYWFAALNYAFATGQTGPFAAASSAACTGCAAIVQYIASAYQDARSVRGGQYTVRSVHADSFFTLQRPALRVVVDRSPRTTISATGQDVDPQPGVEFAAGQITLERDGAQWKVREAAPADLFR